LPYKKDQNPLGACTTELQQQILRFIPFHLHKVSLLVWYFILLAGKKIFGANFVLKSLIFNFFTE
jgi:hypothetical protein